MILGSCVLMALSRSLLGQEFEEKWWSYLCMQVCRHSWETSSFLVVFVNVAQDQVWVQVETRRLLSQGPPLGSCVLRVLGRFCWFFLRRQPEQSRLAPEPPATAESREKRQRSRLTWLGPQRPWRNREVWAGTVRLDRAAPRGFI